MYADDLLLISSTCSEDETKWLGMCFNSKKIKENKFCKIWEAV